MTPPNDLQPDSTTLNAERLGKRLSRAKVIRSESNLLWLRTESTQGCGGCALASGCGTSVLAKLFSPLHRKPMVMENTLNAKEGDEVEISIMESDLIKHSIMVYGVPLIALMAIAFFLLRLTGNDLVSALGGFAGLGLGWWLVSVFYHPVLPQLERVITSTATS